MHIDTFCLKLENINGNPHDKIDTECISVDDIKKEFVHTDAWQKLWANLEKLLKTHEFHALTSPKGAQTNLDFEEFTTKLDFGVLAFLMCEGNKNEKAEFLYYLIQPGLEEEVSKWDTELKLIFQRLIYFAVDLPEKYQQSFIDGQPIQNDEKVDFKKYDHLFEQWIVKSAFCDSLEARSRFVIHLENMDWIFDANKIK